MQKGAEGYGGATQGRCFCHAGPVLRELCLSCHPFLPPLPPWASGVMCAVQLLQASPRPQEAGGRGRGSWAEEVSRLLGLRQPGTTRHGSSSQVCLGVSGRGHVGARCCEGTPGQGLGRPFVERTQRPRSWGAERHVQSQGRAVDKKAEFLSGRASWTVREATSREMQCHPLCKLKLVPEKLHRTRSCLN